MTDKDFKNFSKKILHYIQDMIQTEADMGADDLISITFSADGYYSVNSCEDSCHVMLTNASGTNCPTLSYSEGLFDDEI